MACDKYASYLDICLGKTRLIKTEYVIRGDVLHSALHIKGHDIPVYTDIVYYTGIPTNV